MSRNDAEEPAHAEHVPGRGHSKCRRPKAVQDAWVKEENEEPAEGVEAGPSRWSLALQLAPDLMSSHYLIPGLPPTYLTCLVLVGT